MSHDDSGWEAGPWPDANGGRDCAAIGQAGGLMRADDTVAQRASKCPASSYPQRARRSRRRHGIEGLEKIWLVSRQRRGGYLEV